MPAALEAVLPDVDIWFKAFSRQDPDPLVVHGFAQRVRTRQVFLLGLVRQALLARTRDPRQGVRLNHVLAAFPDLPMLARDHTRAAGIIQRLRPTGLVVSPWQAVMWAIAERLQGRIWTQDRHWQALAPHGCPLV